jgi:erythronate-4-phosphate dehydrogenase
VELTQVLAESDFVTLHVPLTREGQDATWHMLDREGFARMKPGAIVLNAARGPVLATDDLLASMNQGRIAHAVLDTWEGEPEFRVDAMQQIDIGTPHIAGYSFEGKVMGTLMVYREVCRFLGIEATWSPASLMPVPPVPAVTMDARARTDESVLAELVSRVYDIMADDARLRAVTVPDGKSRAAGFDELRRTYPERREFPATVVTLLNASDHLRSKVAGLGFGALVSGTAI